MCKDNKPQNPDAMIVQCSHEGCRKWQHVKCMAVLAAHEAGMPLERYVYSSLLTLPANTKPPSGSKRKSAAKKQEPDDLDMKNFDISQDSPAVAKAVKGSITAQVFIKDEPRLAEIKPASETEIVITDAKGEEHSIELNCLFCGKPVD